MQLSIAIIVFFSNNNQSEYIMEFTDMPEEMVKKGEGEIIFEQTLPKVMELYGHFKKLHQKGHHLV